MSHEIATHPALTGDQVDLVAGPARLTVAQVGASLRRLTVDGADVLDGYGRDEIASAAQGQALVPWPNRLRDGRYAFEGRAFQVPLTEPEKGNAIHGLARWVRWDVVDRSSDRATLRHVICPQPGYPFLLALEVTFLLDAGGVTIRSTALNAGERRLPYGIGFHPYLTVGTERIDDARLRVPARARLITDDRGVPTGERAVVDGTAYDFRQERPIGSTQLDTAFADLERDAQGRAHVTLAAPADGRRLRVWLGEAYRWLMAFTGDALPDRDRRRRSLGIEPMTCPPNALQTGEGLQILRPGDRHVGEWGIAWGSCA